MSTHAKSQRYTIPYIKSLKGKGRIVSLTAYTTPMAAKMDEFVDVIIVGDSTGMVAYGMDSTLSITLDMMIQHGRAVMKGASRACVIIDMPFASYQESPQKAFRNAAKVMAETGAQGIKLEGGLEMLETVEFITSRGIPVMPHIGLMPQHVNSMGGYKFQARTTEEIDRLVALGLAFQECNAFSLLIEGTSEAAARSVTEAVKIPTIGIGASPACDGQVLVTEDVLGLFSDYTPRFVKRYIDLGELILNAFARYENDVRSGAFPALEHCFAVDKERESIVEEK
jgi:3-methyl-2-oxobutanoate hydroxymethyltransferase